MVRCNWLRMLQLVLGMLIASVELTAHEGIPWLKDSGCVHGNCNQQGYSFTTITPQFSPNKLTPPGLQPAAATGQFAVVDQKSADDKVADPTKVNTTDYSAAVTKSPWLTDRELCAQIAAPKIDTLNLPSNCQCADPMFCPPKTNWNFELEADALFLQRTKPNIGALESALGLTPTATEDVDLGTGTRIRMMWREVDCHTLELLAFGTDAWDAQGQYTQGATAGAYDFRSQLYSTEFNFKRRASQRDWLTWVLGVRYIEFSERVQFGATVNGLPAVWDLRADNYMYGIQLGTEITLWQPGERFRLDSYFKGVGMVTAADNEQRIDISGFIEPGLQAINRFDPTSAVGDAGVNATWNLHRQFAIRGGYQFMVIQGVSQIPDIIGNQSDTHTVTFHGGHIGCELRW